MTRARLLAPADALTLAYGMAGVAGMVLAVVAPWGAGGPSHRVVLACVALVVAGCVLDAVDGTLARRLGPGRLGVALDVVADLVAFGLAPAALLARDAVERGGGWGAVCLAAACCFLAASVFRLRRHAREAGGRPGSTPPVAPGSFRGLPMPAAGAAATAIWVLHPSAPLTLLALAAAALLMASTVPVPRVSRRTAPAIAAWVLVTALALGGALPLDAVAQGWLALVAALALRGLLVRAPHARQ